MNRVFDRQLVTWLLILGAFVAIMSAIGAGFIGADTDREWGPLRRGSLYLGLVGFVLPLSWKIAGVLDNRVSSNPRSLGFLSLLPKVGERISENFERERPAQGSEGFASDHPSAPPRNDQTKAQLQNWTEIASRIRPFSLRSTTRWISLALLVIAFELLYVWLVTAGHMTVWPQITDFYDGLADSFLSAQTALEIEPPLELSELDNPYSPVQRKGIPVIGDASYFRGKYYIYWGPAPAAFVAAWKIATGYPVGDEHIVFISVSSIFLFSVLILLYFRRRHFSSMPHWLVVASLIIVATSHPILWVLNWPSIHRAAIAAGQAFMLAGLYFALPVMEASSRKVGRLALVGSLWALAIGSRMTLVGPVGVFIIVVAVRMLSFVGRGEDKKGSAKGITAIGLPFAIGIGLLGLYNFVRFGSALETGLRYQLANDNNTLLNEGLMFSLVYSLPNAVYYLFAPFRTRSTFPFIRPNWGEVPPISSLLNPLEIPEVYHIQSAVGLLFAMPAIVLSGYLVFELLADLKRTTSTEAGQSEEIRGLDRGRGFRRIIWVLLLAGICAAIPSFLYFWVADRFLLDAVPLFALTAAIGSWFLYSSGRTYPIRRSLAGLLILVIAIGSGLVGFLLAFTGAGSRIDDLNPAMYETIIEMFSK